MRDAGAPTMETRRWEDEAQYFDAEDYSADVVPQDTLRRYRDCKRPWLSAEYPFWRLGDVTGKSVLEIGCGAGGNAIVLATKGARVVGVDISSRAIDAARVRARKHGLEDRVTFEACPLERFVPPSGGKFDIICGWAILHHLLPVLEQCVTELQRLAKPGATVMFAEPYSPRSLRRLRMLLPIAASGTPDERPLEPSDLALLARHFSRVQVVRFNSSFAMRPILRAIRGRRYEDFGSIFRVVYDTVARADAFCLRLGALGALASGIVIAGAIG